MNLRLLLLPVVAALMVPVSGCLSCEPLLEAQRCHGGVGACTPDAPTVHDWDDADAAAWPEVDAMLHAMDEHDHLDWSEEKEDAFWEYWGMAGGDHRKDLYVMLDDDVFRIRVLTCD